MTITPSLIAMICTFLTHLIPNITQPGIFGYRRTLSTTRRKTNKPAKSKLNSRKRPVLVVVRKINNKGHHSGTVIEIKSQVLFELLLNINENVDTLVEGRSPPIVGLFAISRRIPVVADSA